MTHKAVLRGLLDEYGETFAEQAGITLTDKPAPLFRLLVLTSLLSANIDARLGLRTAHALSAAGLTTARHLADASDDRRWRVLAASKYLRKEQTARQLGELARQVVGDHGGDLRRLRDKATDDSGGVDAAALSDALQGFTGIGPTGADIFCREVQAVWPGLQPFADDRVLRLAEARCLPHTAKGLADLAGTQDLSRVGAALVLADMADRAARA